MFLTIIYILIGLVAVLLFLLIKYRNISKQLDIANKNLSSELDQKKILFKEVHHRVKNNLTLLKSLLYLRAEYAKDKDVKMVLNECQMRVQSMALVHQNLYNTDDSNNIDFHQFLVKLFAELEDGFGVKDKRTKVNQICNNAVIDMSTAILMGLIINELATNTYKYAFTEDSTHRQIDLSIEQLEDKIRIIYSDTGKGFPKNFETDNSEGFGYKFINILVNQLNGKIDFITKKLATLYIEFPYEKSI